MRLLAVLLTVTTLGHALDVSDGFDSGHFHAPRGKKLVFAQTLWRHGRRMPDRMYPTAPVTEADLLPGLGELAVSGMQEQFLLGQRLRQRYIHAQKLVSSHYVPHEIYVRSTDVNRTLSSAMAHMAGFYFAGNQAGVDYPRNLFWPSYFTPIPVHTLPKPTDYVMQWPACLRQNRFFEAILETPELKQFWNESQPLARVLQNHSGWTIDHPNWAVSACDAINYQVLLDLPVDPWAPPLFEECKKFVQDYFSFVYGLRTPSLSVELHRAFGGALLKEVLDRFQMKYDAHLSGDPNAPLAKSKYYAYSGHDINIYMLSTVLGFPSLGMHSDEMPETSDCVALELWVGPNNSSVVKLLYFQRDKFVPLDLSKGITGCANTVDGCSLEQLVTRSQPYLPPADFQQFCNSDPFPKTTPIPEATIAPTVATTTKA